MPMPSHFAFRIPHPPHAAFHLPHSAFPFRIPHSALRIPHSAFRTPHWNALADVNRRMHKAGHESAPPAPRVPRLRSLRINPELFFDRPACGGDRDDAEGG